MLPDFDDLKKKIVKSQSRPSSPPKQSPVSPLVQSLLPLNTLIPVAINVQPLQAIPPPNMATIQPWGQNIGPLNLGVNPAPLPKGSAEVLPKFSGDGKISTEDHLSAFHSACAFISVPTQEVVVRLFEKTLTDAAADWFNHLPHRSIAS